MKKNDEKIGLVLEVLDDLIAECSRRQENPITLPKVYWVYGCRGRLWG